MKKKDHFIGVGLGWGAQIGGCQDGPDALLRNPFFIGKSTRLISSKRCVHEVSLNLQERMEEIGVVNRVLSDLVLHTFARGERPCILGGDHSIAVGTWNGVKRAVNNDFGLIWIDAHMDSHTFATTPSQAPHGMPLAALLGHGDDRISKLHFEEPILKPEHICLIGTRSYEEGEKALLMRSGVRVIEMSAVKERGVYDCLQEGIAIASRAPAGFGVSFDLDVFDPVDAPGVGSLEPNGVDMDEMLGSLPLLFSNDRFLSLELVEYNPFRDPSGNTKELALSVLKKLTIPSQIKKRESGSYIDGSL